MINLLTYQCFLFPGQHVGTNISRANQPPDQRRSGRQWRRKACQPGAYEGLCTDSSQDSSIVVNPPFFIEYAQAQKFLLEVDHDGVITYQ